ncbi:arsenate reductase-like protein [Brucella intermedia M86]|uniref:Arsenate reductase-like protein n=1 Tax=Brucella intermedia M86 TaxID=1234597 RepID=M5JTC5_9HYPH|nr:arsenate reductase-like protein [Brucella intermedia M86]
MSVTIYGIKNCDTMKKARTWLEDHGIDYAFHDYKKEGLDGETLDRFLKSVPWEQLLNRAGTTFRKLPEEERQNVDAARARALMLAQLPWSSARFSTGMESLRSVSSRTSTKTSSSLEAGKCCHR